MSASADVAPVPPPRPLTMPPPAIEAPAEPAAATAVPGEPEPVSELEAAPEPEARIYQSACPAVLEGLIVAEILPPIEDGECRAQSPLRLEAVNAGGQSVALTGRPTVTCPLAGAIAGWVVEIDGYARAALGAGIAEIVSGTAYQCRQRNNAADGPLSEHGFANALDVAGFRLSDGREVTVLADWSSAGAAATPVGQLLTYAHTAACARFTTVLGPDANELHHDHLHLDLACHGATCTFRLCE
ncbi:MAG: extensin family protein [Cucumibacter sp.]